MFKYHEITQSQLPNNKTRALISPKTHTAKSGRMEKIEAAAKAEKAAAHNHVAARLNVQLMDSRRFQPAAKKQDSSGHHHAHHHHHHSHDLAAAKPPKEKKTVSFNAQSSYITLESKFHYALRRSPTNMSDP